MKSLMVVAFILLLFSCAKKNNIPDDPYRGVAPFGPDTVSGRLKPAT